MKGKEQLIVCSECPAPTMVVLWMWLTNGNYSRCLSSQSLSSIYGRVAKREYRMNIVKLIIL